MEAFLGKYPPAGAVNLSTIYELLAYQCVDLFFGMKTMCSMISQTQA